MEQLLQVGIISSVHGVRGEVKVFPTTDDAGRFKKLKEVLVDMGTEKQTLTIQRVKFFKQFVILKFQGFDDPDAIMPYKGKSLFVTRENAVKLQKDEYFIADLIGLKVSNEDDTFQGILKDVIRTGANDVYAVEWEGREILIPAIRDCILSIDLEAEQMKVHLLDGLLD